MDILKNKNIDENVFSVELTVEAFGTEQLSEDEEKEIVRNFPTKIAYRNLVFTKNVKLNGQVVEVTEDEVGEGVVAVTLPTLSNKEILVDEKFSAIYKVDYTKIPSSALNDVLTSKELVAQAYCAVFAEVIMEEVAKVMNALRSKAPSFEGTEVVSI